MRALTLTWTPILLVLVILVTSTFHAQAQSRQRNVTKAQIEDVISKIKGPSSQFSTAESPDQKLKRLMDCAIDGRGCEGRKSLVINEILLRLQIRDMGEECTSSDRNYSTALYGTPYSYSPTEPKPPTFAYEAWQDELLNTGLTFCNPFEHLSCSPISKKCECRPGTVYKPELDGDSCLGIVGSYCWIPGLHLPSSVDLYDPFTSDFYISGASDIRDVECISQDGIFRECTRRLELFLSNMCTNLEIRDLDENLESKFKDLPRLNFGDSCNLEHQTQLFTTTDAEVIDYKIRVKNLEAILAAKTPFCDLKLLLMCGSGGKCECIKPMTYNPDTKLCAFKNPDETCQGQFTFEKMTDKGEGTLGMEKGRSVGNGWILDML